MKRTLLSAIVLTLAFGASAQVLGESEIARIRSGFERDDATKAIQNILKGNKDIKTLAINRDKAAEVDHFFKYRCNVSGITNQLSSGRCWMFTSMNQLRPAVMEKYNLKKFDFSHSYNFFWDMFEKSNLFLENMIALAGNDSDDRELVTLLQSPVGDGGVWNLFYNIAGKYGVVPQEVMPETEHSNNTSQMRGLLNERLRKGAMDIREAAVAGKKEKALREMKMSVLQDVYRILALCLGEPPTEFTWRYRDAKGEIKSLTTTPKEFYEGIIPDNFDPDTYIMIMNDPTRDYYKVYEIKNYRNTMEGVNWKYLNLPNDVIKKAALQSIKEDNPLYVSCDVGKQSIYGLGWMDVDNYEYGKLLGVDLKMDKKARILSRQSASAHAMLLIGCDTDANDRPVKWEFENSWGASSGNNGYLSFSDEWFDEYLFRIVINRKYLEEAALNALKTPVVELPVWDYMF